MMEDDITYEIKLTIATFVTRNRLLSIDLCVHNRHNSSSALLTSTPKHSIAQYLRVSVSTPF